MITSLQNERVKLVHALQNRTRARRKERKIALEGARLVRDACESEHQPDFVFYTPDSSGTALIHTLRQRNCELLEVAEPVMRHISDTQQPQGIIGVFPMPSPVLPKQAEHILILDGVSDPGNMGTILRTAAAAGVDVVLLGPNSADPYSPKALRSGMGAHFRIPVRERSWPEIREYCQSTGIYAADSRGNMCYNGVDWTQPWALVIGSEAHGLSESAAHLAAGRVYIPMAAATESINAAAAAAVILFEAQRHRS